MVIAAIAVAIGTLLESKTGSHLFAAKWVYNHPFFFALLIAFFINILFSAMRRWPFQKKHIPFLLTHLGLLMVIAGTMYKNLFGLQGRLTLWKGKENNHVVLSNTYALFIESRQDSLHTEYFIPLPSLKPGTYSSPALAGLVLTIKGIAPHVEKKTYPWQATDKILPVAVPLQLEEQRPGLVLDVQEDKYKQSIALSYDPTAAAYGHPIVNGNYSIRFQPMCHILPFDIRLERVRQILYPSSTQIFSYECDLCIIKKGLPLEECTLSMNHVYETTDGFRFYLAGIGTSSSGHLKQVHLAVNYDPVKYILTWPGAAFVCLGALLLFSKKTL